MYQWEFERHGEAINVDVPGSLTLDEPTLMLEAARAGEGLTYLSEVYVASDIAAGHLVRVLEEWTQPFPGLSLYYPSRRNIPAGLRKFIELVREKGADLRR